MQVDLGTISVTIGMPVYGGNMPTRTAASLFSTAAACATSGVRCQFVMERGLVEWARDALLDDFLKGDTDKLFWIDSDMTWEPGEFLRLLALSTVRDVVCAAYPSKSDRLAFSVDMPLEVTRDELGLVEINGIGLGFTAMSRKVCAEVASGAPRVVDTLNGREMASVFRVDAVDGKRRSEDMAFFADIRALGHKVWLDPTITPGHVGEKQWTGSIMDAFTKKETTDG